MGELLLVVGGVACNPLPCEGTEEEEAEEDGQGVLADEAPHHLVM